MNTKRKHFPGIVTQDRDGSTVLGVWFPDFDGCVTSGQTLDEAYRLAVEVLQFHIDGLLEDGAAIPPPGWNSVEELARDDAESRLVAVFAVPADVPTRAKRVNITLEENLLARLDEEAARLGLARSALLAEAARRFIQSDGSELSQLEDVEGRPS
jgi:predicted RNase H-like HicB family nuclease